MASSNQQALARFVDRLLLHSALSEEERQAILALEGQFVRAAAKRDLVIPGETVGHAILVVSGILGRFDLMRSGARQITALHIAGDMCDLHSVVAPTTGWGITALSTATILTIAHGELKRLAEAHPNVAITFWRDSVVDASVLAKWIGNMGRKNALSRVAHLLCEMGVRMERIGLGDRQSYALDLTQEQIGDVVGLTPVHVNRTVRTLRDEGLASVRSGQVDVMNWDRLTAVAEFMPTFLLFDGDRIRSAS